MSGSDESDDVVIIAEGDVFPQTLLDSLLGRIHWCQQTVVLYKAVQLCSGILQGSQAIPFDEVLGIAAYQQTSTELKRLGCLLAVFLPFEVAAWMLQQLIGVTVSHDAIWQWVQSAGQKAMAQLDSQLQDLAWGYSPELESLEAMLKTMPLTIAADGVTVLFRSLPKTPRGKIITERDQGCIVCTVRSAFNVLRQSNQAASPTAICGGVG